MSQDLDQILLLIVTTLGAGFALLFVMAWLEPQRPERLPLPSAPRDGLDAPGVSTEPGTR